MDARHVSSPRRSALHRSALLVTCLVGGVWSCAADLQALNVANFYSLTAPATDGLPCTVGTSDPITRGIYDPNRLSPESSTQPGSAAGFVLGLEVMNGLSDSITQPAATGGDLRVASNDAQLTTLTATYSWSSATSSKVTLNPREFPVSVRIPANGSMSFPAPIISSADNKLLQNKSGTLSVEIKLSGTLADGSGISTTPVIFSVSVCPDCLIDECPTCETLTLLCGLEAAAQPDGRSCVKDATTTQ